MRRWLADAFDHRYRAVRWLVYGALAAMCWWVIWSWGSSPQ